MGVWEYGSMGVWEYGSMGSMGVWEGGRYGRVGEWNLREFGWATPSLGVGHHSNKPSSNCLILLI